jgi:hypothetical protein
MKKDVAILLVIHSSQTVRIISQYEGEYLQKIIEVSLGSYQGSKRATFSWPDPTQSDAAIIKA